MPGTPSWRVSKASWQLLTARSAFRMPSARCAPSLTKTSDFFSELVSISAKVSAIQVGNEVGVRYVLDGAVQMSGERLRVTIQLTDAPAAQIIWAESYDRVFDDIFDVQDEITMEVAVALDIELLTGEGGLIWWNNLPNRTARELALRGISQTSEGSVFCLTYYG